MQFRDPLVYAAALALASSPCAAQQPRTREGLNAAIQAVIRGDRSLNNVPQVPDSAVRSRSYILRYADGRDSTVAGGHSVLVINVTYFHGDTALVTFLRQGPGRAAGTRRPMVDDGGSQWWRFVYVDTAWVGRGLSIVTN